MSCATRRTLLVNAILNKVNHLNFAVEVTFMVLQVSPTKIEPNITWEALPTEFVLPDDP